MQSLVLEVKKYAGRIKWPSEMCGSSLHLWLDAYRDRFAVLMAEQTDCIIRGPPFPEEKRKEMIAIGEAIGEPGFSGDEPF